MVLPMTYIQINSWKISTTGVQKTPGTMNNIVLVSEQGLFEPGENIAEAQDRTYSSGSVLPPKPIYSGKELTLNFLIYSGGNASVNVKSIYNNFVTLLQANSLSITTDYPHNLTGQKQRIFLNADWQGQGRLSVEVIIKCAQA